MGNLAEFKKEWDKVQLIKIFEVPVTVKKTGEEDYIIFDISIEEDQFIASHVGLTEEEEESNMIAFKSIDIDPDFSLDENLQELYDECIQALLRSDFYELREE